MEPFEEEFKTDQEIPIPPSEMPFEEISPIMAPPTASAPLEPQLQPEEKEPTIAEDLIERKRDKILEEEYEPITKPEPELPPEPPVVVEWIEKEKFEEIERLIEKIPSLEDLPPPDEIERKVKEHMRKTEEWWEEWDEEMDEMLQ